MGTSEKWIGSLGGLLGIGLFVALIGFGPLAGEEDPVRPKPSPAPSPTVPRIAPAPPLELRIPSLELSAKIVPVTLGADRTLLPPQRPKLVGWWSRSARPGAARGGTVIAGHRVHTGGGALDRLGRARKGGVVEVRTKNGRLRYRLEQIRTYEKAGLARDAAEIFDQRGPARLVIVTCDDWDGRAYRSNVVVFATPTSAT